MVKKKDYQDILDCIKSDQVSAPEIAEYFEDKGFYKFYKDNQKPTKKDFLEEAEKEKKDLEESYKESKRQTKERKSKEWIKGYRKWKKSLTQFNCKA